MFRSAVFGLVLAGMSAHAGIINGSFESGFEGWTFVDTPDAAGNVGTFAGYAPTDGAAQAFLGAGFAFGGNGPGDGTVAEDLRVPIVDVFNPTTGEIGSYSIFELLRQDEGRQFLEWCPGTDDCFTVGSAAIWQDVAVKRGQRITFDYNFLASTKEADGTIRAAFVTLAIGSSVTVVMLKDNQDHGMGPSLSSVFGPIEVGCDLILTCDESETMDGWATGYNSASLDVRESGIARLGFALLPANRGYTDRTALLLDNIKLHPVPEPAAVGLLAIGLVGGWGMFTARGRRRALSS